MSPSNLDGDRYSIDALMTLYEYEPELRDLYVEGTTDAGFLRWFLGERGLSGINVFALSDRVEIKKEDLDECGVTSGEKQRVMALAILTERRLGKDQRAVTCLVDADLERLVGPSMLERSCLIVTELPALENYVLAEGPMARLLHRGLGVLHGQSTSSVLQVLIRELDEVHAARAALYSFGIRCIDDVAKACNFESHEDGITTLEVLTRSWSSVRADERPIQFDHLREWAAELIGVAQKADQHGRGHDIAPILISMLNLRGPLANQQAFEALIRSSIDIADLLGQGTFLDLESRFAA